MRLLIFGWLLAIASTFFAGLYGAAAMRGKRDLTTIRALLLAKALDGLFLGIVLIFMLRIPPARVRINSNSIFLWAWLSVRLAVAITTWVFVLDVTGKGGRLRRLWEYDMSLLFVRDGDMVEIRYLDKRITGTAQDCMRVNAPGGVHYTSFRMKGTKWDLLAIAFGTPLPEGYLDVTPASEGHAEHLGYRIGLKL